MHNEYAFHARDTLSIISVFDSRSFHGLQWTKRRKEVLSVLTAVQGYFDGNQIVLNDNLPLMNGQKVILTVFGKGTNTKKSNTSTYKIKQDRIDDNAEWQSFMAGINGFTEDFMPNGREPEIPSARETL